MPMSTRIRIRDLEHIDELMYLHYPNKTKPTRRYQRPNSPSPDTPTNRQIRPFGFYICCNKVYASHTEALDHWLDLHFLPFKGQLTLPAPHGNLPSFYYPPNPCKSIADVGNPNYPLVARAEFYLAALSQVSPHPAHPTPIEFTNPYAAALAMAYDFIGLVQSEAEEYHLFLSLILDDAASSFGRDLRLHIVYFPFWADYCYPGLPKVIASMPPPKAALSPEPVGRGRRDADGFYVCATPGCGKKYKQPNGLKYHLTKGQCTVINLETGERPLHDRRKNVACPFLPCSSDFSTPNGLKYHLFKHHLKPNHFNFGSGDLYDTYTCPVFSCQRNFTSSDNLRRHLLECHVRPIDINRRPRPSSGSPPRLCALKPDPDPACRIGSRPTSEIGYPPGPHRVPIGSPSAYPSIRS
ncbi:hypothetical protein L0F63_001643 [Massospora cicadina]|nr:hypothetical protein L0F63_001643 [Massospora cicadina]